MSLNDRPKAKNDGFLLEAINWAQIDLKKAIFFPDAERNKTGDSRVKALADHTVEALQKLTPNDATDREQFMLVMLANKDEHVFDTTNYKELFKRACLKLGFVYLGWQCGQCGVTRKAPEKEKQTLKSCHCPMHLGYIGMTTHGFRRSAADHAATDRRRARSGLAKASQLDLLGIYPAQPG